VSADRGSRVWLPAAPPSGHFPLYKNYLLYPS